MDRCARAEDISQVRELPQRSTLKFIHNKPFYKKDYHDIPETSEIMLINKSKTKTTKIKKIKEKTLDKTS